MQRSSGTINIVTHAKISVFKSQNVHFICCLSFSSFPCICDNGFVKTAFRKSFFFLHWIWGYWATPLSWWFLFKAYWEKAFLSLHPDRLVIFWSPACLLILKAYAAFVYMQRLPSKANGLDMLLHDTCSKAIIFMDVFIPWGFINELSVCVWMKLRFLIKALTPPLNSIQEVIYIELALFKFWSFIYHV